MTFFILKNDTIVYYGVEYKIYTSLFFPPCEFMIWNLELERNVILGLVCFGAYTLSLRVLCISVLLEKLVEKLPRSDWPFLGWHRWFQCSMRCAVIVVCTGGGWGRVFEGGGPEPRAESQSTTGNLSSEEGQGERSGMSGPTNCEYLWVTRGGQNSSCVPGRGDRRGGLGESGPHDGMLRSWDFILSVMGSYQMISYRRIAWLDSPFRNG